MSTPSSSHTSSHLKVSRVSHSFGNHRVLTDISFSVTGGELVGLIGENGSGKSTLLRIIAGLIDPDGGEVRLSIPGVQSPRIGLLHQEPPFSPAATVSEAIEQAVSPTRRAAAAVDQAAQRLAEHPNDQKRAEDYTKALEYAEQMDAWSIDSRISQMLSGLGLAEIPLNQLTGQLSGGQRARLSLAWVLLNSPDVLLLDEPTNHLDDEATSYLGTLLSPWRGPVLLASHDRAFLDESVTSLVDLDPSPIPHEVSAPLLQNGDGTGISVTRFSGTYTDYLNARLDARQRWKQQYRDEQAELKRLRASVRENQTVGHDDWRPRSEVRMAAKFYADRNAKTVSRRVNDARARLKELEETQIRKPPHELRFQGLAVAASENQHQRGTQSPLFSVSEVRVEDRLAPVSFTLAATEKLLVTGANGSGKSTLLSVLIGDLEPTAGNAQMDSSVRVGMLRQEVHLPDPRGRGAERTVQQAYEDLVGEHRMDEVPLSTFGLIHPRDYQRPVEQLSTGQQRRLELAVLLADPPEILLLDEPTNHYSLMLATQLEAAIPKYPGAVIVASHDRWLRHTWKDNHLHLIKEPVTSNGWS
ncbi:ABC-F family ATP-binding cassette domain-containing protein [Nesterenkonia ebinurensis]|uniref:ABC-F family ATP-binding cassette domain-containing protein n=1 Tax=Nesterenkonia ebinurensis TaxID=2608252 RepID=UPI00123CEF35|nr:ABC-F family ATP-binding cassette domain-containing protein [Nesterenkonia ebinurensis]